MKKTALIFPGIGYTKDRPLLYYSAKLAKQHGYEVIHVDFGELPDPKAFGNAEKRKGLLELVLKRSKEAVQKALPTAETGESELLFVSKSLGTVAAAALARELDAPVEQFYLTPLDETFSFIKEGAGTVFFGTADPWTDYRKSKQSAERLALSCHIYEGANHSLETENVLENIRILTEVMGLLEARIARR